MALPAALACGVVAGITAPLLARAGDPTGGYLAGREVAVPIGPGVAFGWSWAAFVGVTLVVWALLAAVRNR